MFAQAQTRIIMKMLKVFSNQLRRVHKQVDNLLQTNEAESPEAGLFKAGEYYLKARQYSQAKYIFSRYLTYYPAGRLAEQASRYLEAAENSSAKYGDGKGPSPLMVESTRTGGGPSSGGPSGDGAARQADARGSNGETASGRAPGEGLSDAAKSYYDAVSLFSSEKYKEALSGFKKIVDANADPEYVAKALYEMGRCLFMLQQYDLTIKHFTQMVQTYPKHPDLIDTLFYLGQSYDKKGDAERAKGFFKKILSMESDEDASIRIKAAKALRHLEEAARG